MGVHIFESKQHKSSRMPPPPFSPWVDFNLDKRSPLWNAKNVSFRKGFSNLFSDKKVSLEIKIDPLNPRSLPALKFHGSETDVGQLNDNIKLEKW